jgi:hypothetical protein
MKLAPSVTLSGSTPRCSTTIFFTRSPMSLIVPTSARCNWLYRASGLRSIQDDLIVVDGGKLPSRSRVDRLTPTPTSRVARPSRGSVIILPKPWPAGRPALPTGAIKPY